MGEARGFPAPARPPGRLGLALGGGAARGWAHLGVIEVLESIGWKPDVVAGTSIGAAVGAALATDQLDALRAWAFSLRWRDVLGYLDVGGGGGLIQARRVVRDFVDLLPQDDIESMSRPFGAVATDLANGREVWLTEGSIMAAARASIAIPGMIGPALHHGRWLVDGGLVNPVPVSLCRALGADFVVAVDLQTTLLRRRSGGTTEAEESPEGDAPEHPGQFWRRVRRPEDPVAKPARRTPPSIFEVMATSVNIMQTRIGRSRLAGDPPELLIAPQLTGIGLLDFHRAAISADEGRRAARATLVAYADPAPEPDAGD